MNLSLFPTFIFVLYCVAELLGPSRFIDFPFPLDYIIKIIAIIGVSQFAVVLMRRKLENSINFYLILLISLLLISTSIQISFDSNLFDVYLRSTHSVLLGLLSTIFTWLCTGYAIRHISAIESNFIALLILSMIIFSYLTYPAIGYMIDWREINIINEYDMQYSHLTIGSQFSILFLIAFSVSYSNVRFLVVAVCIPIIFFIGGRTALICHVLTLALFYYFNNKDSSIYKKYSIFFLSILVVVLFYFFLDQDNELVKRMLFSDGFVEDESNSARNEFFIESFEYFLSQFVAGDVNSVVYAYNSFGSYVHNIYSAYQIYGVFVFAILIFLIYKIYTYATHVNGVLNVFGFSVFFYSLTSLLLGKYIGFPIFWLSVGYWIATINNENYKFKPLCSSDFIVSPKF